ncbi:hypothetical protein ACJ73_05388 [Blastomyces percursus]|uniref:Uncharacterized protein n=1 Tax=Blastomyces percursus TaxID=1658174 RepID=A0A1J9Q3X7_9EURO|nr:hypothetical protein ACJ73_05388 [Blastomyces percursus]
MAKSKPKVEDLLNARNIKQQNQDLRAEGLLANITKFGQHQHAQVRPAKCGGSDAGPVLGSGRSASGRRIRLHAWEQRYIVANAESFQMRIGALADLVGRAWQETAGWWREHLPWR